MKIAARALAVWVILMTLELGNGLVRRVIVEQFVDDATARRLGVVIGSVLVLAVAYLLSKWLGAKRASTLLLIGLSWSAMTIVFEILVGRGLMGLSWARIWSDYDVPAGGIMLFGLLVMALAPLIGSISRRRRRVARRRQRRQRTSDGMPILARPAL